MKNEKMRPYTVMCTDIYLLIMLVVFPLYYADGYFHLPERKAEFYSIATLIYVIVTLLGAVITAFSMREQWSWEALKKNITGTDICMFGFLISNLIALAMSNDVANSWTGKSSRYYGAKVLILVCVSYFLISRYAWINKVFINAFLIGGNGVCLLATFDYFGMDVLGINKQMQPADWLVFISTMGNANTCASYVCMALAGAMVYFCVVEGKKSKIFTGISIVNCSMALITARSDSAFLGIGVLIVIIGVLVILKKIEFKIYILMLGLVDGGILGLYILRNRLVEYLLDVNYDTGIPKMLNQPILLIGILIIVLLVHRLLVWMEKKQINMNKKSRNILFIIFGIVFLIIFVVISKKIGIIEVFIAGMGLDYDFNVGSRVDTYQKALGIWKESPLKYKIFGAGQASISTIFQQYYGVELYRYGMSINSTHNNILEYLLTVGTFGVISYIGVVVFAIKHTLKITTEKNLILVLGGIIIAYFLQGVFNIEQTNTTTIFWMMIACCEAVYRQHVIKKEV